MRCAKERAPQRRPKPILATPDVWYPYTAEGGKASVNYPLHTLALGRPVKNFMPKTGWYFAPSREGPEEGISLSIAAHDMFDNQPRLPYTSLSRRDVAQLG